MAAPKFVRTHPAWDINLELPTPTYPFLEVTDLEITARTDQIINGVTSPDVDPVVALARRLAACELQTQKLYEIISRASKIDFTMRPSEFDTYGLVDCTSLDD